MANLIHSPMLLYSLRQFLLQVYFGWVDELHFTRDPSVVQRRIPVLRAKRTLSYLQMQHCPTKAAVKSLEPSGISATNSATVPETSPVDHPHVR